MDLLLGLFKLNVLSAMRAFRTNKRRDRLYLLTMEETLITVALSRYEFAAVSITTELCAKQPIITQR